MRCRRTTTILLAGALALTGVLAGTAAGAAPRAVGDDGAPLSGPALVATGPLTGQAFYTTSHGTVYQRSYSNFDWGQAQNLGGAIYDAPAATLTAPGTILLAVEGTDRAVWIRQGRAVGDRWTWGGWQSLGGVVGGGVGIATTADGRVTLAVSGNDGSVWVKTRTAAGAWSGWTSRGGAVVDAPAVTAAGELYVTGYDNEIWAWTADGHWAQLGGETFSAPGAAHSAGLPTGWIVVTGSNGRVYAKACAFDVCSAGPWTLLGGQAFDQPGAAQAAAPSNATDFVVRGEQDGAYYLVTRTNSGFSTWHKAWTPTG